MLKCDHITYFTYINMDITETSMAQIQKLKSITFYHKVQVTDRINQITCYKGTCFAIFICCNFKVWSPFQQGSLQTEIHKYKPKPSIHL